MNYVSLVADITTLWYDTIEIIPFTMTVYDVFAMGKLLRFVLGLVG